MLDELNCSRLTVLLLATEHLGVFLFCASFAAELIGVPADQVIVNGSSP